MTFRYQPLRKDKCEIRLLEILLGKDYGRVSFQLHNFILDDAPPFRAISYVWGDGGRTAEIYVNNKRFYITCSLFRVLKDYTTITRQIIKRPKEFDQVYQIRYLWVDAICINQNDLNERAQQVMLMGQIYRRGKVGVFIDMEESVAA